MARTRPDALAERLAILCEVHLRRPIGLAKDDVTGAPIIDFDPALTLEELTTFDVLVAMARSGMTDLTPTQYTTIRTNLQTLRAIRQPGRNAFMALTAAERDRLTWDAIDATLTILLAMLRDA